MPPKRTDQKTRLFFYSCDRSIREEDARNDDTFVTATCKVLEHFDMPFRCLRKRKRSLELDSSSTDEDNERILEAMPLDWRTQRWLAWF